MDRTALELRLVPQAVMEAWVRDGRIVWKDDRISYDGGPLEGAMAFACGKKAENMRVDPGWKKWYSYYGIVVDGTVAGFIGPKGRPREGAIEVGYGVDGPWRGKGLASAALARFVELYFLEPMVSRIVAHTAPDNAASMRVLGKNGFARRGVEDGEIVWSRDKA